MQYLHYISYIYIYYSLLFYTLYLYLELKIFIFEFPISWFFIAKQSNVYVNSVYVCVYTILLISNFFFSLFYIIIAFHK